MPQELVQQSLFASEFFHGLTEQEINNLISRGVIVQYEEGEIIFQQGSIGSQLYIIIQGTVGVFRDDQLIAVLGPSEVFGEMGVITKQPRSATTKALQSAKILVLSESIFERQLNKKVIIRLLLNTISILSNRLREHPHETIMKMDK